MFNKKKTVYIKFGENLLYSMDRIYNRQIKFKHLGIFFTNTDDIDCEEIAIQWLYE